MEEYVERGDSETQTRAAKSVCGLQVITKAGNVLGRVKEVRLTVDATKLKGIIVSRGPIKKPLYMSATYISKITPKSVMLSIDPALLLIGKHVISSDGKKFGKIVGITRGENTNKVTSYTISRWFKKVDISATEIAHSGSTVRLKKSYEQAKASFGTQRT